MNSQLFFYYHIYKNAAPRIYRILGAAKFKLFICIRDKTREGIPYVLL